MNILEICSGAGVNGAIIHSLLLSRELARRGRQVTMVCRPGAWIGRQLADDPVEVVASDLHRWPTDELRRIAALVQARQIDVIHTHMSRAHFFGILLRWMTGVPCVATAHSRHVQLHWMFNDQVVAVSEATRRYHRWYNFVRPGRIETVHNFIDYRGIVAVTPDARRRVRDELHVAETDFLLGAVGDVVPRKGLVHLIEAMPQILQAAPNTWLLVVGTPINLDYAARVKARAEELGVAERVIWAGHREDMAEVFGALDLSVLASLEESLPLSILEAMAAGLAVVATTAGGIAECVAPGETGILVPPGDSHALAEAIVHLLADPRERRRLGAAGRARVEGRFSPESQIASIEAILDRVVRRRRAA